MGFGRAGSVVEEFEDPFGGSGHHRPVAQYSDRTLHQARVDDQKVHHRRSIVQGGRVDGHLGERGVPADHVGRRLVHHLQDADQQLTLQRFGEVRDDVELDVALLEDLEGAPGLTSTGVVDQQEASGIHGSHAPDGTAPVMPP